MNHKKKILFLVTQSEFGGAQRFIYTLVNNLEANKYDILVGAGPEGDDENGLLSALEKKRINTRHLKYLRRGVNPFFDFGLGLIEIKRFIKKEKPNVLFLCSSKAGAMGSLAAALNSKFQNPNFKVIYRIGGWAFNDPRCFLSKSYYRFIERVSAKWKDVIINNVESDRRQAIKLGIKPRKKILTIYNGINKLDFLSKEKAREELRIQNGFVVGAIANDYPSKGIKYLIKAAKEFQNIEFVIIGKGNRFIPEAYKYLKAFDVFVLPSVKEGFPWTILEAMAAAVPIVATKVGAVPEVIKHNKTGILVKPRDSRGLVKGIKKLLRDKNLREKFAREAKKTVEEKFTLKQMVKKYEDLFSIN
jgi:glycosyltransferase involved in cell wall biosynthesis